MTAIQSQRRFPWGSDMTAEPAAAQRGKVTLESSMKRWWNVRRFDLVELTLITVAAYVLVTHLHPQYIYRAPVEGTELLQKYGPSRNSEHEEEWIIRDFFQDRHNGVFVDVGANIGTHALPLAKLVGASGTVYAYEPQRMIYEILKKNVEANHLPNVRLNWAAVGAADSISHIPEIDYSVQNNFGEVSTGHGELEVPMIALDSLQLPRLNLIKIDVEGAEAEVLRGAASTIARQRPILYVENNKLEKSRELVELIRNMGY
jgi:FkbM family methyltransferase